MTNLPLPASLWAATACPPIAAAPLSGSHAADVVVVGAGYTGLSAALHLAEAGRKVVVLDAGEPGWGASGRNGGQIIAGLKHDPETLAATFGPDLGGAIAREFGGGADLVFDLINRHGIDCHPVRSGWIQGAHGQKPLDQLVTGRCRQWAALGVAARLLGREEMARLLGSNPEAYIGGWFDPRGGVLQPLSYARGLARAAARMGAEIHAASRATGLRRANGQWEVSTPGGQVTAPAVLLTTNAYTDTLWPTLRRTVIPVTSFQIATRPLPEEIRRTILPGGQGVADTRRLLLYFRLDHEGRLVMGGRSPVDDAPELSDAGSLQAMIGRIFPQAAGQALEFAWTGRVAVTGDSMPHLHMLEPGLFSALGLNGRGVAAATVLGRLAARLASGAPPADLPFPVTGARPIPFHAFRKVGIFALSQWYRLLDRLESRA